MDRSLLFLPDISGYTHFVNSTEKAHSQQVIAELLEVLISANSLGMDIAEVEGDAVFFYLEDGLPSLESLLAQVETMFSAFYSHLELLASHRICPCRACETASQLELKIVSHCAELEFIEVQGKKKPYGSEVIEAHRLLKNDIESNNYVLISSDLATSVFMPMNYRSKLYHFKTGESNYDGKVIRYGFSIIDKTELKLVKANKPETVHFNKEPTFKNSTTFDVPSETLFEYITNYQYRHHWVPGVDEFIYDPNEVTKLGTEHMCVINHKHLNFIAVNKASAEEGLHYGEMTKDTPFIDTLYTFYTIKSTSSKSSLLTAEVYVEVKQWWKKPILKLFLNRKIIQVNQETINRLKDLVYSLDRIN